MFTCSGDGSFDLDVPLDSNGEITVYAFCSGLAPYKKIISPDQGTGMQIQMLVGDTREGMTVDYSIKAMNTTWALVEGTLTYNHVPVCAMALANGQYQFTCDGEGSFSLLVPLDDMGSITLYNFCEGLPPYQHVATTNEISFTTDYDHDGYTVANGDCNDFNAEIYPGIGNCAAPPPSNENTIPFAYVQWRNYEDISKNRLAGWLSLPEGITPSETLSITLKNSLGGTIATLDDFHPEEPSTYYTLNCTSGNCISSSFIDAGWYTSSLPPLTAGTYTYTLELTQGDIMSKKVNYLGQVHLPPVPSESMTSSWNPDGSLSISWENPATNSDWDNVTMIRLYIYTESRDSVYVVKLSPEVNSFTIPASELARAYTENELDVVWIRMQTRAYEDTYNSNYARGLSNTVFVEK